MMRDRALSMDGYGIGRYEYYELKAFCRQYREKKRKASDILLVIRSQSQAGSPVEQMAIKRDRLLRDIQMIESAATETAGGGWEHALVANCCDGIAYSKIDKTKMPSSNQGAFYHARREFFYRLKLIRSE